MKKMKFEKNSENKILKKTFDIIKKEIFSMKNFLNVINVIKKQMINFTKNIILLGIPFILMDYFIREETKKIDFTVSQKYSYIFSFTYIFFFVFSSKCFKGIIGKVYYIILFIIFFLLFLTNIIFFSFSSNFFQFKLLAYASEGSHYMIGVILGVKIRVWIKVLIIFYSFILSLLKFGKSNKNNFPFLIFCFLIIIFAQYYTKNLFPPIRAKNWKDIYKPQNLFKEFTNPNKCMKIAGFYKYVQMDFFKTYLNFNILPKKEEKEELEFLKKIYKDMGMHAENEYTGIFKDKNVILVQLESMDNWLLNKNNTPTLHSLKNNSFVFSDHYSYRINAGPTFNSEFCVNTGFYNPLSITGNSFDFYQNTFNSLPKTFKKLGYTLKSFHFNNPDIYHRDINYLGWGYDKFLSLMKINNYKNKNIDSLDTELIKNKIFYKEIFNSKGKFLYYIITYSIHLPFSNNEHSHYILKKKFGKKIPKNLKEDDIAKIQAAETDEMVKLLMEGLKKNNLYNDTIIIFFADHCAALNLKLLSKYKKTYDKRINHTPFFIWSANMKGTNISKTSCQLDILPTILNLFGIPFQEKSMIGRDIFDKNNSGIAFFDDYSWIDGKILVNNGNITKLQNISEEEIDRNYVKIKTQEIRERFKQNDLTLKYDYLKNILNKK